MNFRLKSLIIFVSLLTLFSPSFGLYAADSDFNPNYILSDEELQDYTTMNRADIQAFLQEYGSWLVSHNTPDAEGVNRTASDIIYRAAITHKINPKYLLVKLQKEQSLITDPSPAQKQLDWATGYGICDSCSMSDPALQKHKGFGVQVDSAAAIMRWYYDNLNREVWIKTTGQTYLVDNIIVRPATLATAFLYTYTPHLEGNQNFWRLWQKWFEQVYPDGSLIKTADRPTVYLLQNGTKRAFANMSALITRFDPKFILTVPESELKNYPDGAAISIPNYSILKSDSQYYLLDNETLRPFDSFSTVKSFGYHPDEIIEVNAADLTPYKSGRVIAAGQKDWLGKVTRIKENNQLYYLAGNNYHLITDKQIAKINFPNLSIEEEPAAALASLFAGAPVKLKDGVLFGIVGNSKIYVVENGKKRHIASEAVFNGLGFNWNNIIWVDEFTGLNLATGEPLYLRREVQIAEATAEFDQDVQTEISADPEKMLRAPENKTELIGPTWTTALDTYLVAEYDSGEILAGKNIDFLRPAASLTKVMTAYILMKSGLNLNGSQTYEAADHRSTYHSFRVAEGERIYNQHLLYAGLVSSLNTPIKMLVDTVEENETVFITKMNDQARAWELNQTKFADVTGENVNTKTTAREYFTIYKNAANNIEVSRTLGTKYYEYDEIKDRDGNLRHYDYHSNELANRAFPDYTIINSKTGYLDEAGDGLVMLIRRNRDAKKFIIITLGNPDHANKFAEPARLTSWVITNF